MCFGCFLFAGRRASMADDELASGPALDDERLCPEKKLSSEVNPTALTQLVIEHLQMAKAAGNIIERLEKALSTAAIPGAK